MSRPKVSRLYNHAIIFSCRNCNTEFNIYREGERYCHSCGAKQDWRDITFLSIDNNAHRDFQNMSFDAQKAYLEYLDRIEPLK